LSCQLPPDEVTGAALPGDADVALGLGAGDALVVRLDGGATVVVCVAARAVTVNVVAALGTSAKVRPPAPARATIPAEPVSRATRRRARSRACPVLRARTGVVPKGVGGGFVGMTQLSDAALD
jgi:hypothetical protein